MPLINVKVVEGVFDAEQNRRIIHKLSACLRPRDLDRPQDGASNHSARYPGPPESNPAGFLHLRPTFRYIYHAWANPNRASFFSFPRFLFPSSSVAAPSRRRIQGSFRIPS